MIIFDLAKGIARNTRRYKKTGIFQKTQVQADARQRHVPEVAKRAPDACNLRRGMRQKRNQGTIYLISLVRQHFLGQECAHTIYLQPRMREYLPHNKQPRMRGYLQPRIQENLYTTPRIGKFFLNALTPNAGKCIYNPESYNPECPRAIYLSTTPSPALVDTEAAEDDEYYTSRMTSTTHDTEAAEECTCGPLPKSVGSLKWKTNGIATWNGVE